MLDRASRTARPLRVGLFVSDFPLLSETFVTTLAEDLLAAGHDLRVMARDLPGRGLGAVHEEVAGSPVLERVTRSAPEGRMPLGRALSLMRAAPARAPALAALWALDRIKGGRTTMVTRHLAALPPLDVVHAQFATLGETAQRHRDHGTLRARALVVHLRGYDVTRRSEVARAGGYARIFARAEIFVAASASLRRAAIELGCPAERCEVIGSPIDAERFAPPPGGRAPWDGARPLRLVCVGRLVEKKGFGDAVEAVARLREAGVDARLDILGEGEGRADLERRIGALRLGGQVALQGAATRARVIEALHAADIGLAPSVTARSGETEGIANALKEMMATGLPVVATAHGGTAELVRDGESGRLVPEGDPAALARALADLAAAPEGWAAMGAAGRAAVVRGFERGAVLRATEDAYRRALAEGVAR